MLGVQFNHKLDSKSSLDAMELAYEGKARLFIIVTEIAKDPSPWSFNKDMLYETFGEYSPVTKLCELYSGTAEGKQYNLFDLITALYLTAPEIFPEAIRAMYSVDSATGFVILTPAEKTSKSELWVVGLGVIHRLNWCGLKKHLEDHKLKILSTIKDTFEGRARPRLRLSITPAKSGGQSSNSAGSAHSPALANSPQSAGLGSSHQ